MQEDKKITIKTIADRFGVAESTVSRAFNPNSRISDGMRNQILQYAREHNFAPNRAAAGLRRKHLNIGFVCATADPTYTYVTDELKRGLRDACQEMTDTKVQLYYEQMIYSIHDPAEKTVRLQQLLEEWERFDGIIVSGFHDRADVELLNRYSEEGRPIVLLQNNQPDISSLFVSCLDATTSSRMAAELIAGCLKKSPHKNVALFTGDRCAWLHSEAERIFRDEERCGRFHIMASYDMKDSSELLQQQVADLYNTHTFRPDAIYISSGISSALCEYIKEHGLEKETIVVAFDISPQTCQYLKEGMITAVINQNLYSQAQNAFRGLVSYLVGYHMEDNIVTPAPTMVFKSNAEYYLES